MGISVVIPAYNEEHCISRAVSAVRKVVKDPCEVIVVDDGSLDQTSACAKNAGATVIRYEKNRGKGFAVKQGLMRAKYDIIFYLDADLAVSPKYIPIFIKQNQNIVVASRYLPGANVRGRSFLRLAASNICLFIINQVLGLKQSDVICGFKMLRKEVVCAIVPKLRSNNFAFDAELLLLAKKYGFSIKEVPVQWRAGKQSSVLLARDAPKMLGTFFRLWLQNLLK